MIYSSIRNIRNSLTLLLLCLALAAPASERPDSLVTGLFLNLSDSELGILPKATRQDMLDYLDVDSLATRPNAFRGDSRISRVATSFMEIRLSNVSTLQIKMLQGKRHPVLMTVYTISGDGIPSDSEINFYDADFRLLSREKYLPVPDPRKFWNLTSLTKEEREDIEHDIAQISFYSLAYAASPQDDNLSAEISLQDYLTQEMSERLSPYLDSKLMWLWDGKRYKILSD